MLQSLPVYQRQEAFLNCWVRKEAYIKAIGNGLYHALDQFDVSLAPGEPARLVSVEGSAKQAFCWSMKSLTPEDGYVAALAVKGSGFCFSYWQYPEKISNFLNRFSLLSKLVNNIKRLPLNPPESASTENNCFFEWSLICT
jgi:4'-phosphopantetheinyl transferase